jgi:hypothetical protein
MSPNKPGQTFTSQHTKTYTANPCNLLRLNLCDMELVLRSGFFIGIRIQAANQSTIQASCSNWCRFPLVENVRQAAEISSTADSTLLCHIYGMVVTEKESYHHLT